MSLYTVSILLSCSKNTESSFAYTSPQHQDTGTDTDEPEEDIVQETVWDCIEGFALYLQKTQCIASWNAKRK